MGDQAVCLTCAVEELGDPTMYPQMFAEVVASFVEQLWYHQSIGENLPFLAFIGQNCMRVT